MSIAKYFDSEGRIGNRNATTGFHLCMTGFEFPKSYPPDKVMVMEWGIVTPLDAPTALPTGGTQRLECRRQECGVDYLETSLVGRLTW